VTNGWFGDGDGNETGDICNADVQQFGDYTVQTEWSNQANACLLAPQAPDS
jgi:hypothetical protein